MDLFPRILQCCGLVGPPGVPNEGMDRLYPKDGQWANDSILIIAQCFFSSCAGQICTFCPESMPRTPRLIGCSIEWKWSLPPNSHCTLIRKNRFRLETIGSGRFLIKEKTNPKKNRTKSKTLISKSLQIMWKFENHWKPSVFRIHGHGARPCAAAFLRSGFCGAAPALGGAAWLGRGEAKGGIPLDAGVPKGAAKDRENWEDDGAFFFWLFWGNMFWVTFLGEGLIPESACEGFFVKKQPLYYIFTPSHLLIYIFTPSHLQIYIFTPSHLQI